jgi:hypothetical protein
MLNGVAPLRLGYHVIFTRDKDLDLTEVNISTNFHLNHILLKEYDKSMRVNNCSLQSNLSTNSRLSIRSYQMIMLLRFTPQGLAYKRGV